MQHKNSFQTHNCFIRIITDDSFDHVEFMIMDRYGQKTPTYKCIIQKCIIEGHDSISLDKEIIGSSVFRLIVAFICQSKSVLALYKKLD